MSDEKTSGKKLTLGKGRLELRKTVETGQVKQSFSHGRSKTVIVEKKSRRAFDRGGEAPGAESRQTANRQAENRLVA